MLVRRALTEAMQSPPEEEFASHALDFFLQYYRIHKLDFTYVYDGVLDSLTAIRNARPDLPMAVLTNKPVRPSREICKALELSSFFFQIYGGDSFVTKKPDPEGLHTLLREASTQRSEPIAPQQCLMIGDSGVDVLTARNAGTQSLGCTFGLSPHTLLAENPDALSESPHDWRRLLLGSH
jgi:phosphoglycolate phosphatase